MFIIDAIFEMREGRRNGKVHEHFNSSFVALVQCISIIKAWESGMVKGHAANA